MISLCQLDRRWSDNYLGHSRATIGRWGCTTTSICMLISKFTSNYPLPNEAARKWKYIASGRGAGSLYWSSNFEPLKFIKRGYWNNKSEISKYANSKKKGVLIAVNGDSHWLVVDEVKNGVVYVYDPINFNGLERLSPRYRISGYALFESTIKIEEDILDDKTPPPFAEQAIKYFTDKGWATQWDTPNKEISDEEIEIIFKRMELFTRQELAGKTTKAEFVTGLYRILEKGGLLE